MKDRDFGVDMLLYSPRCSGAIKDTPVAELDGHAEVRQNSFCSS